MLTPDPAVYLRLFEYTLDAAFLTRPDVGGIVYANPAACQLFGYTLEEFCALEGGATLDWTDPRLPAALEERRLTGRFRGTLTHKRKDGTRFSGDVSSALFAEANGDVRSATFIRDISEQEEREDALRQTNAALTRALDEIQQLRGILPICSYCKSIRNDQNYWLQVESYLSALGGFEFTHGVCPTCYEKHVLPQLDAYRDGRR